MKILIILGVMFIACNAQDTVKVQQTIKYENLIITIHDTVKVLDKVTLNTKIDSVNNFWKNMIVITNKELQNAIEVWSKKRGIKLYD